ncbi:hypothetical protein [Agrilutibacter solisilvae]|uniref:Uncharacterized protein n=1 Tax=Agrilutibacter solisilvae TaxID=2763317 RepID=A0A974Y5H1_9GAMM|nr:hypothetical protein [Lysobacter solisilvae]QSX78721.1 hypothetical protein I8J32_001915 [Lysobacter solisilvae]
MSLETELKRLSALLTPPTGYTNDTKVFAPEPGDPHADLKTELLESASRMRGLGEAAVGGASMKVPFLENSTYQRLEALPSGGREDFFELANAIQAVATEINRRRN